MDEEGERLYIIRKIYLDFLRYNGKVLDMFVLPDRQRFIISYSVRSGVKHARLIPPIVRKNHE